jgi:nucleoside phosphorylase
MGAHNVVIAVMPETGNRKAAAVATQLLNDFTSIRFGLLVGVGGGIPDDSKDDIRLGDVVVSKPTAVFGGVVEFDCGRTLPNGQFERTGSLGKTPKMVQAYVEILRTRHIAKGSRIPIFLSEMREKCPKMEDRYTYQGENNDQLFEATYHHHDQHNCHYRGSYPPCRHHGDNSCQGCDPSKIVRRARRTDSTPVIHYGTIGSSSTVIRDSVTRENLKNDLGLLCVEMEAAGLMDDFQCLVIRGICDYADSHKNKRWQPYAAATAAAYAKELLSIIPAQEIVATIKATEAF